MYQMIENNLTKIESELNVLQTHAWIDRQSVAIFLEFTLFNVNLNLFQSCVILFEITQTGSFVNTASFSPVDIYDLNSVNFFTFKIMINFIYLTLIVVLIWIETRKVYKKAKINYFLSVYNWNDAALVAFSWSTFSMYLYRMYIVFDVHSKLKQRPLSFINLQSLIQCDLVYKYFLSVCLFLVTIRFIKILRFSKRVIVFVQALRMALGELVWFGLALIIVWMSFVQLLYLLLNAQSVHFSSFPLSVYTSMSMILGKFDALEFFKVNSVYSPLTPIVFVFFNISIVFVMLNMFVSTLIDYFHKAKGDTDLDRTDPNLGDYLRTILASIFQIFTSKRRAIANSNQNLEEKFDMILVRIEQVIHVFIIEDLLAL